MYKISVYSAYNDGGAVQKIWALFTITSLCGPPCSPCSSRATTVQAAKATGVNSQLQGYVQYVIGNYVFNAF